MSTPLSKSLDHLRRAAAAGTLDPVARHVLDSIDPDWHLTEYEKAWRAGLTLCRDYVAEHSRFPRVLRPGHGTEAERRAGNWLARQRHGKRVDEVKRRVLDRELPGWDRSRTTDTYWKAKLRECAAWTRGNRSLPRVKSPDPAERLHGLWLQQQRNGRNLTGARIVALDQELPGWRATRGTVDDWKAKASACAAFTTEHRRKPSRAATDQEERRLALWIARQRSADLTDDQRKTLDGAVPGWRGRG